MAARSTHGEGGPAEARARASGAVKAFSPLLSMDVLTLKRFRPCPRTECDLEGRTGGGGGGGGGSC